jgi:hypothetical protein
MAFKHGKDTVVSVNSVDLSAFTNSTDFNTDADVHDTTTFGQSAHTFQAGLTTGTATLKGIYDSGASGPGKTLRPLLGGASVTLLYKPEGTGTGKPSRSVSVVVKSYNESAPVADMITWQADLQMTGAITDTTQ